MEDLKSHFRVPKHDMVTHLKLLCWPCSMKSRWTKSWVTLMLRKMFWVWLTMYLRRAVMRTLSTEVTDNKTHLGSAVAATSSLSPPQ